MEDHTLKYVTRGYSGKPMLAIVKLDDSASNGIKLDEALRQVNITKGALEFADLYRRGTKVASYHRPAADNMQGEPWRP